ncbi:hypothetical protein [Nocardia barduliensis]|uniref:hypothetical protein n=1 Tax=Nocardia barduliensis TaxID=2736643 RepID=UPI0015716B0D|nr:hypothetical protein [Nocardia barduliensis]
MAARVSRARGGDSDASSVEFAQPSSFFRDRSVEAEQFAQHGCGKGHRQPLDQVDRRARIMLAQQ